MFLPCSLVNIQYCKRFLFKTETQRPAKIGLKHTLKGRPPHRTSRQGAAPHGQDGHGQSAVPHGQGGHGQGTAPRGQGGHARSGRLPTS